MNALLVRRARDTDAEAVVDLLRAADVEATFVPDEFHVVEDAGRVVAAARLRTLPDGGHELASVAVAADARRRGLGTRVVRAALGDATGAVWALAVAPAFFRALGFRDAGGVPPVLREKAAACAARDATPLLWAPDADAHAEAVRAKYGAIVTEGASALTTCEPDVPQTGLLNVAASDCGGACATGAGAAYYTTEELATLPDGAYLGLGTGNPVREAALQPGEVVLDLGSGAGVDVLLAAHVVGPDGWVVGVDFTPEMVERARENAARAGFANVDVHEAPIEKLPLPDASVDAIVSNCVVNLSPDKPAVLREAHRVLKPGGRFIVSDTLDVDGATPSDAPACDCTSGALSPDAWEAALADAGFTDARVTVTGSHGAVGRGLVRAVKAP